tara:strand:- start:1192 stop:1791 length:600 start_codon:yes stop_codon:yes gene_type:complete
MNSVLTRIYKRFIDLFFGSIIILIISLPLLFISLIIKLTSRGPIIFKQSRYGLNKKKFVMWKFRSMTFEKNAKFIQATSNDPRITKVGKFLRKTSLDELPQFFNVILGTMSIVGPRPHPIDLDEKHKDLIDNYMNRYQVKPGITGLAQISGWRGETDTLYKMEKRIECDLKYIANWNLLIDIKIIFQTVFKIIYDRNAG